MNEEEHLEDNSYEQFLYEISNTAIDCGQEPYEAFFYRVTNLLIEEGKILL